MLINYNLGRIIYKWQTKRPHPPKMGEVGGRNMNKIN